MKQGNDNKSKCTPFKCCYFSIDAYHDYHLQGWTNMESNTVIDKPDLSRIRYGQILMFPGGFIHGSGFDNIGSDGDFRIQLLIIYEGHKLYDVIKYHNDTIDYVNISDKDLSCYNFGEEDPNYNNRSVKSYAYSSFKNIDFYHVKKTYRSRSSFR